MKISIVAVGQRQPAWADQAVADYLARFPSDFSVTLKEVKPEPRSGAPIERLLAAEALRLRTAIPAGSVVVALDERGKDWTTAELAEAIGKWRDAAETVAFVIGVQAAACAPYAGDAPPDGPIVTLADGIAVKRPGAVTAPLVERWLDDVVTVDEDAIADAMVLLMERAKLYVEGAGAVGLEEYEHAKARGAKIYAELGGYGMSADAGHMTAPNMDGPRRAMINAMRNAGVNPDQINYLNAHGTSTPLGDKNESNAIKAALGDAAYKTVVSSTKSMTGHLLGGAGGVESVFTVMAIHDQKIPPTINQFTPDPECDLDSAPNKMVKREVKVALSNAFGFGGHNATLAVKKFAD